MEYEVHVDRGVNCYFCGEVFDERYTLNADPYNDGDGGEVCRGCLQKILDNQDTASDTKE